MSAAVTFVDDHVLRVGDTGFYCDFPLQDVPAGLMPVMKSRALVERYIDLVRDLNPAVIVELGILRGGSTVLLSELSSPDKLLAFEIDDQPRAVLSDYVEARGLGAVVRPYYGVDQADRSRVTEILADELGSRPIDLVVDDASHLYEPTLSSFEVLFPRLRPGGLFVLEDWNGTHVLADVVAQAYEDVNHRWHEAARAGIDAARNNNGRQPTPFVQLVVEFLLVRASSGDTIRDVTIDEDWVVVRRGADPLDARDFRLSDLVNDRYGYTTSAPEAPTSAPT
jgi:predicted O-methyltransferase YrrM